MNAGKAGVSAAAALCLAVACGSDDAADAKGSNGDSYWGGNADAGAGFFGSGGGTSNEPGGSQDGGFLPPEVETKVDFERPHAGKRFVYAANPDSDTVAVIDATTLAIDTVLAGDEPRYLETLAGRDEAIVLNVGSADATIIRTDAAGSHTSTVKVRRGANAIRVAPDGKHAIVYYDAAFDNGGAGAGSVQDIDVLTLDPENGDRSTRMTVGFRPSDVSFRNDGARAYLVTEDGVSIVDFAAVEGGGGGIAVPVPVGAVGIDHTLDVAVTSDGLYALAREEDTAELRLVDLATGAIRKLDLAAPVAGGGAGAGGDSGGRDAGPPPAVTDGGDAATGDAGTGDAGGAGGNPPEAAAPEAGSPPPPTNGSGPITDVDLAPGGTYALAVLRSASTVVRIPIPGGFDDPGTLTRTEVPGELIGSVTLSPGEKYALLYTTVDPSNERMTILPLDGVSKARSVQLRKSIQSIAISPEDRTALVVHGKIALDPNEPGIDDTTRDDRSDGYSLVQLDTGFPKLEVTPGPLGPFQIVPDGSHLFILFDAPTFRGVQRVTLSSFEVEPIVLGSPPVSVGAVPETNRVFVGQNHPDGRISFVDWATGTVQSVTGFELNSRIRE